MYWKEWIYVLFILYKYMYFYLEFLKILERIIEERDKLIKVRIGIGKLYSMEIEKID